MSFHPEPPGSRPMPPNYTQASGPQQPYAQQPYAQQAYGAQPGYGMPRLVNPAMFDSRALPEYAYGPGSEQFWAATDSERTTALWSHLGAIFFGFVPLIMYLVKKDESPYIREHSRQGLNAMITNTIITTGAVFVFGFFGFLLALVTFGFGLLLMYAAFIVPVVYFVLYIIAAVAANRGEGYRFPLTISFVK